jgi:RNA polymerase sigma-70 factor (ECF subfamily)
MERLAVAEAEHVALAESELAARAVAGDEDALTSLLRHFGPRIRAQLVPSIQSKWSHALEADDVMQITYLEAFLRISRFQYQGPDSFGGWLSQIARNNLRDAIRELERLKRPQPEQRVTADGTDTTFALLDELGCTTSTPSRHAAREDVQQFVELAIAELPDDYASVIRMYDLEGKSASDVASSLGRSEGAVFMLRARAHDRLREAIGPETQFFSRPA